MFSVAEEVGAASPAYRAQRALDADGTELWVVVDDAFELHVEACAYLSGLRAADRSINTERTYARRVALYLSYCAAHGVDWARPTLGQLHALRRWLVDEPLPARSAKAALVPRFRQESTASQILGTVGEFMRWCALNEWVPWSVVSLLVSPRVMKFAPPGFDRGEDGTRVPVEYKALKYRVAVEGYEWFSEEEVHALSQAAERTRERFLVELLGETGMRIGEALGLRRGDMHLLPDSRALGCKEVGAHVHVRRRLNSNGALAKSRFPRTIPVSAVVVSLYAEYRYEREEVAAAEGCDMVFVNLYHAPLGEPMKYHNAYEAFKRLVVACGLEGAPHKMRHYAISHWLRTGTRRDVAQQLAGHQNPSSMDPYVHVTDEEKREAVERVAEKRLARSRA